MIMRKEGAMERSQYAILLLKKKYCCTRSVDVAHDMIRMHSAMPGTPKEHVP